jgi:multicomponent Na+:H+ antiporter subunit G
MDALDVATGVLFLLGAVLSVTGSVGIVRMPDFYSRLHPAGKTDTAGQFFILGGLVLQAPDWVTGAKLMLVIGLLAVSAPTASHAITKAAWLAGLRPWTNRPDGHELNCPGSIPLNPDVPADTTPSSADFPSAVPAEVPDETPPDDTAATAATQDTEDTVTSASPQAAASEAPTSPGSAATEGVAP